MKKLSFLLLIVIVITSCTDRGRLERREDRIEGSWYFDRAFYKEDLALFRDNIIRDFRGDQITFYEEGYAEYYDASLDAYFSGDWFLTLHKTQYHDGNERLYTLDMEFLDHIHRERFSFYSNATRIGFNNLNLEVYDDFGFYTFRLNKLD
ncbi:hypothetical protein SAMN05661096_03738 [Marivirga sericea]|uniref:Lipocalin-like domain-containing protein n=1 Tax=Marivirga sericea TaxID=1028 RepID=A0A1X7LBK5_9BACT|nr:hypothetical protein [Marivirga sericea]SMG50783.1 hypothetical protein SAMN05661096_03738 [Marivirga sericea]